MNTEEKTYSLAELRVREYIRLLIESLASTVVETLHKKYEKFVDIEKIRFTNTKSDRKQQQKLNSNTTISDFSANSFPLKQYLCGTKPTGRYGKNNRFCRS